MTASERLKKIEEYTGCTTRALAINIGLKQPQTLYDIHKGKHGFSKAVASSIQAKYLNFRLEWILYGDEPMLKDENITNGSGVVIKGNNTHSPIDNRHYYSDSPDALRDVIRCLEEERRMLQDHIDAVEKHLKEKDAQIKEKDAQIKQLLDILSRK